MEVGFLKSYDLYTFSNRNDAFPFRIAIMLHFSHTCALFNQEKTKRQSVFTTLRQLTAFDQYMFDNPYSLNKR